MAAPVPQFALTEAELLKQLGSFANGLTSEAAATILQSVGPNRVAVGHRQTALRDLLHRCRNPLVIQLFIIASVSYAMGDLRSTVVVGGMVFATGLTLYVVPAFYLYLSKEKTQRVAPAAPAEAFPHPASAVSKP